MPIAHVANCFHPLHLAAPNVSAMEEKVKALIVVVGIGEMGLVHAQNLSKDRRIRLGIASTRPNALKAAQSQTYADAVYSDYTSVFEDNSVTGVVIATPPETHPDLISQAIRHKKHIFCEKPLGNDSVSIRKSLGELKGKDLLFMTGFMRRFDPGYSSIDYSKNEVCVIKCTSGDSDYPEKYRRCTSKYAMLKDLAVHDIDLIRWMTNSEIHTVYTILDALTYPDLLDKCDGDVGICVVQLNNGSKGILHLGRAFKYGYNVSTEVVCKNKTFKIGELSHGNGGVTVLSGESTSEQKSIDPDFRIRFQTAFELEMKAFVDVVVAEFMNKGKGFEIVNNDERYADGHDGLVATLVAEAMVESSISGLPVKVKYEHS